MFASFLKNKASGRASDDPTWEKFLSYFDAMANGVDEEGNVLYQDPDGAQWSFVLIFGQGDLEQLCINWGVQSYNNEDEICGCCLANRSTRPFTNLQENAEWRPTCPLPNQA